MSFALNSYKKSTYVHIKAYKLEKVAVSYLIASHCLEKC